MSEARITQMLEQYARMGFGGVFIHARPGLIIEYLSERWMELWGFALAECRRLGLICNIYDENSYPSCFAGGHVPARLPFAAARSVLASVHRRAPVLNVHGPLIAAYRLLDGRAEPLGLGADLDQAVQDHDVLILEDDISKPNPWTAYFPLVDTTRPEVAREFIATTYQAYFEHFPEEFGQTIRASFIDEPHVMVPNNYPNAEPLAYSELIECEFSSEHGYALRTRLADLFVDQPGCEATRFDYYRTLQRLFTTNFLKPIHDWCADHDVLLLGHFFEHLWPMPAYVPDVMDAQRWLQIPGIDLLACNYDFDRPENNDHFLMTVRELQSVVNQLGRSRAFCEAHGAGGYGSGLAQFKGLGDWLLANGVNFIGEHLSYETVSGARKYDCPPTFSDHSPWWDDYSALAEHTARLSFIMSQGRIENRLLVLHPTTTGWVRYNPLHAKRSIRDNFFEFSDSILALQESQGRLVQWLCDRQADFDLGSELLLGDLGRVETDGWLHVGQARYRLVLLPAGMENCCRSTLALLAAFLRAGGRVLAMGQPPSLIDGRPDDRMARLARQYQDQWLDAGSLDRLGEWLDDLLPPLVTTEQGCPLGPLVGLQQRQLADGRRVVMIFNGRTQPLHARVRLAGRSGRALDSLSGAAQPLTARMIRPDQLLVDLQLDPGGHALWVIGDEPEPARSPLRDNPRLGDERRIVLERFDRIERTAPNVLGLDFCDLEAPGVRQRGLYVTHANRALWQAQGLAGCPWDRTIQFKRNFIDMRFEPGASRFALEYHFQVAPEAADWLNAHGRMQLAVERPELYQISLNGQGIDYCRSSPWWDENIHAAGLGCMLIGGDNRVRLEAMCFDPRCEADRVYLLGEFAVHPCGRGFALNQPQQLGLGDWTGQGLAMYGWGVRYETTFELADGQWSVEARVPHWRGSVARLWLDGQRVGQVAWGPCRLTLPQELAGGVYRLGVEVIGNLDNLLGPHFAPPEHERFGIPNTWDIAPDDQPSGASYRLSAYGLFGPVEIVYRPVGELLKPSGELERIAAASGE